jgi:periplasmic divalent cation tolerance protein
VSSASGPPLAPDFLLVFVTFADADNAARIGRTLVEERLAACVNVIPGMRSIYEFGGKLCDETEALALIKTRRSLFPALRDRVATLHAYQVPEIIAVSLDEGHTPYLEWLVSSTALRS